MTAKYVRYTVHNPPGERMKTHAGQKKKHSALESVVNVLVGYGVALASQIVIFPLFGMQVTLNDNIQIGLWFTAISLIRSYILRRIFNHLT